jgi:hypothetical protein
MAKKAPIFSSDQDVRDAEIRARDREAYNKASKIGNEDQDYKDTMRLRKAVTTGIEGKPNSDRINMGTYVPGFEKGRTIDIEEGMQGLREAENAIKRETRGTKDTSLRGKFRELTGMASGGSASSRADGCAERGKTKGTVVGMNKGGMSC